MSHELSILKTAILNHKSKRFRDAGADYLKLVNSHNTNIRKRSLLGLVKCLIYFKEYQIALRNINTLFSLKSGPLSSKMISQLFKLKGFLLMKTKNYSVATELFFNSYHLEKSSSTLLHLFECYYKSKNSLFAISSLIKYWKTTQDKVKAFNLAILLKNSGRTSEAKEILTTIRNLTFEQNLSCNLSHFCSFTLGNMFLKEGDLKSASEIVSKVEPEYFDFAKSDNYDNSDNYKYYNSSDRHSDSPLTNIKNQKSLDLGKDKKFFDEFKLNFYLLKIEVMKRLKNKASVNETINLIYSEKLSSSAIYLFLSENPISGSNIKKIKDLGINSEDTYSALLKALYHCEQLKKDPRSSSVSNFMIEKFESVIKSDPANPFAIIGILHALLFRGHAKEALNLIKICENSLSVFSGDERKRSLFEFRLAAGHCAANCSDSETDKKYKACLSLTDNLLEKIEINLYIVNFYRKMRKKMFLDKALKIIEALVSEANKEGKINSSYVTFLEFVYASTMIERANDASEVSYKDYLRRSAELLEKIKNYEVSGIRFFKSVQDIDMVNVSKKLLDFCKKNLDSELSGMLHEIR